MKIFNRIAAFFQIGNSLPFSTLCSPVSHFLFSLQFEKTASRQDFTGLPMKVIGHRLV